MEIAEEGIFLEKASVLILKKALSPHKRNLASLKLSWCFHFKGDFSRKKGGNEVLSYNSNLGINSGTQKDFYTQREFARSEALILNTSKARLGSSIGCSTICGHQMGEETCK